MALFLNYTQKKFGQDKRDTLTRFCRECDVRFACNGGCPKNRFATSPYGEPGQHHLCPGYQDYVREPMEAMMLLLRQGRAPSELMSSYALDDSARGGCSRLCPSEPNDRRARNGLALIRKALQHRSGACRPRGRHRRRS
jgi:hypothetical protein